MSIGLKVGLYTSPHYVDFRERIKVNGAYISKKKVVNFTGRIKKSLSKVPASFFELTVAMAFEHFHEEDVDVAVIETGLGGRLDSTNVITPWLSIITNISFDHMHMLGNTLEAIAGEKAGIIKKDTPVVIGEYQKEVFTIFESKAKSENSKLFRADKLSKKLEDKIELKDKRFISPLPEMIYLQKNLRTSLAAIQVLESKSLIPVVPQKALAKAVKNMPSEVKYMGRWQTLQNQPKVILDSAHNEAGLNTVFEALRNYQYDQLHIVMGFVSDKDLSVLKQFPKKAKYYFCQANIPRALHRVELKKTASSYGLQGNDYSSVRRAFSFAKRAAGRKDMVLVLGSIFVVAEVLEKT